MELKIKMNKIILFVGVLFLLCAGMIQLKLVLRAKQVQEQMEILLEEYQVKESSSINLKEQDDASSLECAEQENANEISRESVLEKYPVMGVLTISTLQLKLPVIQNFDEEALNVSVCRYSGPVNGTEQGNIVISGHNYVNGVHFGHLKQIELGDQVSFLDEENKEVHYQVAEKEIVAATDMEAIEKVINEKMLTLFTCTDDGKKRLVVRCITMD